MWLISLTPAIQQTQQAIAPLLIPLIAAGITAGATAWSNNRQRKRQEKQNEADRQWQEEMYERQRVDAIEDFQMQNSYNSPQEQMNRLRQAGLNPNLVYGKGANNTAESIRSSNVPSSNQPVPGYQKPALGSGLDSYFNIANIQAQTDNLQQGIQVGKANEAKLNMDTAGSAIKNAQNSFDLAQAQRLKDITVESAILDNQKKTADIVYTLDENQRQELANTQNTALTAQKIISEKLDQTLAQQRAVLNNEDYKIKQQQVENMKQQLENAVQDGRMKKKQAELWEDGINPSDPTYIRLLLQALGLGDDKDPNWKDKNPFLGIH